MNVKSEAIIEQDLYGVLSDFFKDKISGNLYLKGTRPANSDVEDAVLTVSSVNAGQKQEGRFKINVYIKDIDINSGRFVRNIQRIREISALNQFIISVLNENILEYAFSEVATKDIEEPKTQEHFVNFNIEFKRMAF